MKATVEPARGRGRPKGPCNKRERAQRRVAAIKDGQHATGARRLAAPCKRDGCPVGYPCAAKLAAETAGGAVEMCPVLFVADPTVVEAFEKAIGGGNLNLVGALAAHGLASQHMLFQQELGQLMGEGTVIETAVEIDDETTLTRVVANPRAAAVDRLAKVLGYTARDQATTPHSRGETVRNLTEADHLAVMAGLNNKLVSSEGDAGGVDG